MTPILTARAALALVYIAAGLAKWRQGPVRFARTLDRFSTVPPGRQRSVALTIITGEVAAGVFLLTPAFPLGAGIAAVLSAIFAWAVSVELLEGRRPMCGCFANFTPMRVSPLLLAGDLTLCGLALFVVATSFGYWEASWLWLVAFGFGAFALGGAAQAVRVAALARRRGLAPGTPVPELTVPATTGSPVRIGDLAARGVIMLFVSPYCRRCRGLLEGLRQQPPGPRLLIVVVGCGSPGSAGLLVNECGCDPDWTIDEAGARRIRARFRISRVPSATALTLGKVVDTVSPADLNVLLTLAARIEPTL
jgi:hypothetical protein